MFFVREHPEVRHSYLWRISGSNDRIQYWVSMH